MGSKKKRRSNRQNAQKSTGPKTPQGKVVASRNAVSHGAYSGKWLLDGEDPAQFEAFYDKLWQQLAPHDELEGLFADDYIWECWRLRRLRQYEAILFDGVTDSELLEERLERFSRIKQRVERSRDRALRQLETHQAMAPCEVPEAREPIPHTSMPTLPPGSDRASWQALWEEYQQARRQAIRPSAPEQGLPPPG